MCVCACVCVCVCVCGCVCVWMGVGVSVQLSTLAQVFEEWSMQYGDVFGCRLGRQRAVVLGCPHLIREAFVRNADSFVDRPVHLRRVNKTHNNTGEAKSRQCDFYDLAYKYLGYISDTPFHHKIKSIWFLKV